MKKLFLVSLFFALMLIGCADKQPEKVYIEHTKLVYIKPKLPKLNIYEFNKTLDLTLRNKNKKVCVKEWSVCMPKQTFKELSGYIIDLKAQLKKCNSEIRHYNIYRDDVIKGYQINNKEK